MHTLVYIFIKLGLLKKKTTGPKCTKQKVSLEEVYCEVIEEVMGSSFMKAW